ncbi:DUF3829 domain-containing protein [Gilliamella sp. wkB112]|uniref:DUF3829 domain-containing protein n=1 Tax=Gilliamella sp. wkB112 TaxID=3120257 RepID=UPI00080EB158|nr:DUF3829 domain-containing protein [Gilliamella apicola]OCG03237.1 hypothetical protein A9G12_10040 [Gilliamella apicola]
MNRKKFLAILITSLLILGCNEKSSENKVESTVSEPTQAKQSDVNQSELLGLKAKKANLWLDVLELQYTTPGLVLENRLATTHMIEAIEQYFEKYTDKDGHLILNNLRKAKGEIDITFLMIHGIPRLDYLEKYSNLITKLVAYSPELPALDATGKVYGDQFIELGKVYIDFYNYYKVDKEYKLDDFAKSEELNNRLLTAYKNYLQAKDSAFIAYNNLYNELHQAQKIQLKKEGLLIIFNIYEALDLSEEFVSIINDKSKDGFANFDKSIPEQKLTALEAIANELKSSKITKDDLKKEGIKNIDDFYRYRDALSGFLVQAKVVLRDIHEKNINNQIDHLNEIELNSVIEKYNSLVR